MGSRPNHSAHSHRLAHEVREHGATITHVRRKEIVPNMVSTLTLLAMAALVAWGRFGPHAL
jgi:hypothetical protein